MTFETQITIKCKLDNGSSILTCTYKEDSPFHCCFLMGDSSEISSCIPEAENCSTVGLTEVEPFSRHTASIPVTVSTTRGQSSSTESQTTPSSGQK